MINLLPAKNKKELREERGFQILLVFLFALTCALISFALMLGIMRVYLATQVLSQESRIAVFETRFSTYNPVLAKIQEFNEKVSQVQRFLKSSRRVSTVVDAFASTLSGKMYVTAFDWDPAATKVEAGEVVPVQARISVSGFAPDRGILFAFRENLQKNPLFSALSFPPSNWVQPKDIRFSLQTSIHQ